MKFPSSFTGRCFLTLVFASSLLVGCRAAPQATPVPTQDPAVYVAAAVSTIRAQMTADALRNPSPTPNPSATPLPSATPIPPTDTPAAPTSSPTAVATIAPAISAKFLSAGTFPKNKFDYVPNEKFGLAIRFLNTGSSGWQPGSRLVLTGFQGEVTVQKEAELSQGIDPGKAAEFDLWAFGSETLGKHIWYFQLYSAQGLAIPGGSAVFSYTSH